MTRRILGLRVTVLSEIAALTVLMGLFLLAGNAAAQAQANPLRATADDKPDQKLATSAAFTDDADPYFKAIYRDFYDTYKLGPADLLAVRVVGQPDYSLEKVQVSPVGRIYHPLIGDVDVAGLTITRATEKLQLQLGEFIRDPKVSVSLIEANSAKIGVLGDVNHPGIVLMARPMSVLDAIAASGGVSDLGSKSDVTVLRQAGNGTMRTLKVNVKRIMEAKANPEENLILQAGDTVIVHGNFKKKLSTITSLAGFGSFVRIVSGR
ncbi:MAG TPA: polysaccharide biosynthesis/export family protein [Blastocatellia bacterium]|nr:polysaccharide biosynthesis/export family protein [Blastocatellia bacterium]